jgi:hypothetical protein
MTNDVALTGGAAAEESRLQVMRDRFIAHFTGLYEEVKYELTPPDSIRHVTLDDVKAFAANFYYVPYLPAFWNPGWLKNYAVGIVTPSLMVDTFESIMADFWAGITVSLCLIPQGTFV